MLLLSLLELALLLVAGAGVVVVGVGGWGSDGDAFLCDSGAVVVLLPLCLTSWEARVKNRCIHSNNNKALYVLFLYFVIN